ncbi:hypothetical protein L7F22_029868 [Adiantum nelumboides]|nr:hypothetical protein [Adiantum nelumboides]
MVYGRREVSQISNSHLDRASDKSQHLEERAIVPLYKQSGGSEVQSLVEEMAQVQGILEDVNEIVRNEGKTLLALMQHSSVNGFNYTIRSLMKLLQKNVQEKDFWHGLYYKLGRSHSTFVQLLTKDLLIELKAYLSGEAGLDAPECGCILFLFVGASETNTTILSLVPSQILSLAQLMNHRKSQLDAALETRSTNSQENLITSYLVANATLCITSDRKQEIKDYLAHAVTTCWNTKKMLVSGVFRRSLQILRRNMKRILSMVGDDDQVALTTYVLHYVECIYLLCQGWVHFQLKESLAMASVPSLYELACTLEFVVKCMQHTYIGHTDEQKLDLVELSIVPAVWRMFSIASRNDHKRLLSDVEFIKGTRKQSLLCTPFMEKIQKNLLETATGSVNVQETLCELGSSFWPRLLTINDLREIKADLSIPQNDLAHPTEFLPDMPFSITVSIFTRNFDTGKIWMRICFETLWTNFVFLDAHKFRNANSLVISVQIPGLSVHSKCTLEAALYLECPGGSDEVVRGPTGYLLPLTPNKLIYLMPAPGGLG